MCVKYTAFPYISQEKIHWDYIKVTSNRKKIITHLLCHLNNVILLCFLKTVNIIWNGIPFFSALQMSGGGIIILWCGRDLLLHIVTSSIKKDSRGGGSWCGQRKGKGHCRRRTQRRVGWLEVASRIPFVSVLMIKSLNKIVFISKY